MGHDKLQNMYKTNFSLVQYHRWNLSEIEGMIPWERYVYIDLLKEYLEELEREKQLKEQEQKAEISRLERQAKQKQQRRV